MVPQHEYLWLGDGAYLKVTSLLRQRDRSLTSLSYISPTKTSTRDLTLFRAKNLDLKILRVHVLPVSTTFYDVRESLTCRIVRLKHFHPEDASHALITVVIL